MPEPGEQDIALAEAIQSAGAPQVDTERPAVLVGFVLVAEFMDADGHRWLTRRAADGSGGQGRLPEWQVEGYLHNALFDAWPEPDSDADDSEG